jgi:tetratricopeptide (TPR) repeat protein
MVVVTSRDSLPALVAVRGAHRIELDLLPPDDAITLLRRLIGARVSVAPDAAASLAAQCAYLPLALRIVAEMATSRPATRLAEVVEELSDEHRRLDLLDTGDDPRNAVETVFSWSYGALSGENGRAFRLFGIQVGADISARAYAALADCDPAEAGQLLRALGRAHLVATHGRDRYGTHDLLRAYAKRLNQAEDTDAARKAALTRLLDHYLSNAASAMDAMYPAERQYRPHVIRADATTPAAARAWLDAERHNLVAICVRAAEWPERAIQLSAVLNRYLEGDHHTDALTIHTAALISARHTRNRAAEAHCLTYLGSVYRMLGQYQQATEYYDQALEMHVGNGDLFGEARTESNLGIIDERLGQLDASTAHYERALVLFRRLGDKHGEATTLNNFAGVYFPAKGRHDLAAANYSRSRALYEELGDRVGEAIALSNLGAVEGHVGHYELAAEHHLQAVAVFRELGHRYGEASALNGLGDVLVRLGRHREAAAHHEHALAVFRELGHRYGEAAALNGLGEAQCAAGDYAAALAQHRAALALTQQTGDRDEEDRARNGLASAAGAQAVDSVQANAAS